MSVYCLLCTNISHLFLKNYTQINRFSLCTDKNLGKAVWPHSRWPGISGQEGEVVARVSPVVSQKGQSPGWQQRKGKDRDHKKCDTRGLNNTLGAVSGQNSSGKPEPLTPDWAPGIEDWLSEYECVYNILLAKSVTITYIHLIFFRLIGRLFLKETIVWWMESLC